MEEEEELKDSVAELNLLEPFGSGQRIRASSRATDDDEEEFFDAHDVFDKEIIAMLKLDDNF